MTLVYSNYFQLFTTFIRTSIITHHLKLGNFLDISKAFYKVWHEGLLYKLESIGISGNLVIQFRSFLNNRYQRVVINGQHSNSNWAQILAGVPQGSISGPLLFLIYINDLPHNLNSVVK